MYQLDILIPTHHYRFINFPFPRLITQTTVGYAKTTNFYISFVLTFTLKLAIMNSPINPMNIFQTMVAVGKGNPVSIFRLTPELPNELWIMIFSLLGKKFQGTEMCMPAFLALNQSTSFDKSYISPHRINVDDFTKIAQHPTLSLCPRVLLYESIEFKSYYR